MKSKTEKGPFGVALRLFRGIFGDHFGIFLDHFGVNLGQIEVFLEPVWGLLGAFGFISVFFLGGVIFGNFESYCGHFGAIGHFLDHFGVISVSF